MDAARRLYLRGDELSDAALKPGTDAAMAAERLPQPALCLRAGKRFDAISPILPQAVAA
jgi:hypothetical protein